MTYRETQYVDTSNCQHKSRCWDENTRYTGCLLRLDHWPHGYAMCAPGKIEGCPYRPQIEENRIVDWFNGR